MAWKYEGSEGGKILIFNKSQYFSYMCLSKLPVLITADLFASTPSVASASSPSYTDSALQVPWFMGTLAWNSVLQTPLL